MNKLTLPLPFSRVAWPIIGLSCRSVLMATLGFASIGTPLAQSLAQDRRSLLPGAVAESLPDELLIQFSSEVTDSQITEAFTQGRLQMLRHVRTPAMEDAGKIGITQVRTSLPLGQAANLLSRFPGVEYAEPNRIYRTQAESDDPFYTNGLLWGAYGDDPAITPSVALNAFGTQAEKAWAAGYTGSADVLVGIIDTGIQFDHPDLAANIWTNPGEIPGNGIDDDGNGYIDDVHGWNSATDSGAIYDPGYDEHGTHLAGTIGAVGGNGIGVAGINWNVRLVSGKFMGRDGSGSTIDAIQALDYMTSLRTRKGLNVIVLNCSWGGWGFNQALLDAISRAAKAGILISAAAGNASNNNDQTPFYPASYDTTVSAGYPSVLAAAALDNNGLLASFSNFGAKSVHLGAPGVDINSTFPVNTYSSRSGTSIATPHVSGGLALYASSHPTASGAQIRSAILSSGVQLTPSLAGKTSTGGRLDLSRVVAEGAGALPVAPQPPTALAPAALYSTRVKIAWADKSADELGFQLERSTDGQTFQLLDTVGANTAEYMDRTVQPNLNYFYRVRSYRPGTSSTWSATAFISTAGAPSLTPPAAPSNLNATASIVNNGRQVNVSWNDNAGNEDGFEVERKTGNQSSAPWVRIAYLGPDTVAFTDFSVVSITTYTYRVRAYNSTGASAYSGTTSVKTK